MRCGQKSHDPSQVNVEFIREPEIFGELASRPGINEVEAGIAAHRWHLIIAEQGLGSSRTRWFPWPPLFLNPHVAWCRKSNPVTAADMLAWVKSGFSLDRSVRITLFGPRLCLDSESLEHSLRYCTRPPFAFERLSVIRVEEGRVARVRSLCRDTCG
jgi:hypothetical protein